MRDPLTLNERGSGIQWIKIFWVTNVRLSAEDPEPIHNVCCEICYKEALHKWSIVIVHLECHMMFGVSEEGRTFG